MVDSLNLVSQPDKRVDLSLRIAHKLQDSDWERSLVYFELAEKESKNTGNQLLLGKVYFDLAKLYHNKGVLDVGLDYYLKTLNIYKDFERDDDRAKVENNLAIIYAELNDQHQASKFFRKVFDYQSKNKDTLRLAQILNNMGTFFLKSDLDSSQYFFQKSLKFTQVIQDTSLYIYNYTSLGRVGFLQNNDSLAYAYFKRAKTLTKFKEETAATGYFNDIMAKYFSRNKIHDSAIYYAKLAIDSKGDLYNFNSMNSLNTIYENYIEKKDYEQATHYFQLFNTVRDSLNIEAQAVNVESLRLQEEFKSKTKIRQLQQEKKQFRYLIIGLALLTGILTLLLILFRFRNRIQKNRLEKELLISKQMELRQSLESKNKALVGKAMGEIHRTDIINGILNDLKQIKRSAVKKETQHAIDYILKRLKLDLNTDIWKEFEVSFEQVHKSFYKNLQKLHPDLTPKDRRLCAMLFLDLTSKEISQLTGQNFKSVENARTRLRKKLDLTNTKENLSTYLNTLA